MVNLLSGYPDIYRYPTDSDIIRLVLLAIYFEFINTSSAKYKWLKYNYNIDINLNVVSKHKNYFNNALYISKLLEIVNFKQISTYLF